MKNHGLDCGGVRSELSATCQSVILTDPSGRRQAHTDLKDIQETAYPLDVARRQLAASGAAVLCNIEFSRPLLALAQELKIPVATDVHVLSDIDDPYNREFIAASQVLFLSDEGLRGRDPRSFITSLVQRYRPRIVVMGCGSDGALMYESRTGTFTHERALQFRPVVNTIGAGDALFSCFIQGYFSGLPPAVALRRAVAFAGWKVGSAGGAQGLLTSREIDDLLSNDR